MAFEREVIEARFAATEAPPPPEDWGYDGDYGHDYGDHGWSDVINDVHNGTEWSDVHNGTEHDAPPANDSEDSGGWFDLW